MYQFNIYSAALVIIYLALLATMEYFSYRFSWEYIYFSLPLIASFVYWSFKMRPVCNKPDGSLTKREGFNRDFFLISFSFISGQLLSLLLHYNNSDAHALWPISLYLITIFGMLFAFVFSFVAMMLNNHSKYTFFYSLTIVFFLIFTSLMMRIDPLSFFAQTETFYMLFLILIGVHLLICLAFKISLKK